MTTKRAIEIFEEPGRIGYEIIKSNDIETCEYNIDSQIAINMAKEALVFQDSIVRCKDCKYYIFDMVPTCTKWGLYGSRTKEEGFCYKGERK